MKKLWKKNYGGFIKFEFVRGGGVRDGEKAPRVEPLTVVVGGRRVWSPDLWDCEGRGRGE